MRLAVVVSHPIQYYAPMFRELASRCDLTVFYCLRMTPRQQAAAGFGTAFEWDVDLFSGYQSEFLRNVSRTPGAEHFWDCDTPEIGDRLRMGQFDALLVIGWHLKSYLQATLAAKRIGLPVMVRGDSHLETPRSALKRHAKALINPNFLRLFNGALYVGTKSRAFYEHYRYPAHRMFHSPHCVDNDWFSARATPEARRQLRHERGIDDDTHVVLFAGKLVPFKRPLDVVASVARAREIGAKVDVMVAGSGALEADMRRSAAELGVPLHMLGFCNQTGMPAVYAAADVLMLPSNGDETWGLVANEALACGRPVIVSEACGCAPDLAADGNAGRVAPLGDIDAFAAAIHSVIGQPPSTAGISARARAHGIARSVDGILAAAEAVRRHSPEIKYRRMQPETKASTPAGSHADVPPRILVLFGSAAIFGAERGNLEALTALKEQGAEILCLIRDECWSTAVPPALDARGIAWRKVPYVEQWRRGRAHAVLLRGPWAWLVANWCFVKAVREFKPTHIHAYSQLFVMNFLSGLWLNRVPMVFRAGDEPTVHNAFWRATWRITVGRTARFVANAEFVARSLSNHGVPGDRVSVIYNVPPARPKLAPGTLKLAFPPGARVIAFVGQIAAHKGPHLLVAAFRRLASDFPDIHLALAGRISEWSGDAWARALRDRTADDAIIASRVTFLGDIEDVPALLARSEVLVVPSLFEDPSPNVVMEAKRAGRACIVFPRGGLPELIEDGADGLICESASEEALVRALRKYCESPEMAARHGAHGLETIGRFGHADFADRWSGVYALAANLHDLRR